jgi:hypothetical protein
VRSVASDRELDTLKALQSQAAAAVARSDSIANQRKLRKAQEALIAYQSRKKTGAGGSTTPGPGMGLREYEAAAVAPRLAPIDRKNRDQVTWRQTELQNMGANITVDGVWGPITEWYEAMANNGNLNPETGGTAGSQDPAAAPSSLDGLLGAGGGASRGGGGSSGGGTVGGPVTYTAPAPVTPSSSLSAADFKARVLAEIPQAAAFLQIPDLVPILQDRLDNKISDQEFAARVQQTDWYRTTPTKTRAWMGLYAIDPATADRQVEEQATMFKSKLGEYALTMADVTLQQWSRKILSGEVEGGAFDAYLKEQAKSLFPTLAGAIDAGFTVRQYADQYAQRASQRLGIAPESINFSDEKWRRALVRIDPKTGERSAMNLDEWDNEIRTNPIYGYDNSAEAIGSAAKFAQQIGERFGKVAS